MVLNPFSKGYWVKVVFPTCLGPKTKMAFPLPQLAWMFFSKNLEIILSRITIPKSIVF